MNEKQYLNIKEVSKLLNIKEHVIRHWDSIDPKTNKIRFQGLSIRSKGGTRYFNKDNIKKLQKIKNLLFENGKHNYSLDLVNKIISGRNIKLSVETKSYEKFDKNHNKILKSKSQALGTIIKRLRNLEDL